MVDSNFFGEARKLSLKNISEIINVTIDNAQQDQVFSGVAPIENASPNHVTFLSNSKYIDKLKECKAGACILAESLKDKAPTNMCLFISSNPYADYAKIATAFYQQNDAIGGISDRAFIGSSVKIGDNVKIESGAYISDNVTIGDNTHIKANSYIDNNVQIGANCTIASNVTISHSIIADNAIIHPGVRIGQDGFGFATDKGVHIKVPQLGRVIIEDNVEIGANSCIDRGASPDTIIGAGTKIDNLVQIGHNVKIGKGCIIVSHVGISGSTEIGNYVVIGGQTGIAGHLKIGDMVQMAAQSGVINNIEPNIKIGGAPAIPIKEWHRQTISIKKLAKRKLKDNA